MTHGNQMMRLFALLLAVSVSVCVPALPDGGIVARGLFAQVRASGPQADAMGAVAEHAPRTGWRLRAESTLRRIAPLVLLLLIAAAAALRMAAHAPLALRPGTLQALRVRLND